MTYHEYKKPRQMGEFVLVGYNVNVPVVVMTGELAGEKTDALMSNYDGNFVLADPAIVKEDNFTCQPWAKNLLPNELTKIDSSEFCIPEYDKVAVSDLVIYKKKEEQVEYITLKLPMYLYNSLKSIINGEKV